MKLHLRFRQWWAKAKSVFWRGVDASMSSRFLPLGLIVFSIIPLLLVYVNHSRQLATLATLQSELKLIQHKLDQSKVAWEEKQAYCQRYAGANADFVSKTLARQTFLEREQKRLQHLARLSSFGSYKPLIDKLHQMESLPKTMSFKEGEVQRKFGFTEKTYLQKKPVNLSFQDFSDLLLMIEGGENHHQPELIIKEAKLTFDRGDSNILSLQMNLLQRQVEPCVN